MSWIPVFDLGLWNAWIPSLFIVLHPFIMKLVDKAVGTGNINAKMGDIPTEEGEKKPIPIPTILLMVLFVYTIFLPLKLGTTWFYVGLAIYLIGIGMFLSAIITAARAPSGKIFTGGAYCYSRHPLYLSFLLTFLGVSVASTSWLFLLLSLGWMYFPLAQVNSEERGCLDTFGVEYQEYMNRTPQWIGIPKSR